MEADEAVSRAGVGFGRTLAELRDTDWERPACGGWSVRQVANHVVGVMLMYSLLLQGRDGSDLVSMRDEDHLGNDPVSALAAGVSGLAAAIRQPSALEEKVRHPRAELPAAWLPVMATEELVVHGWDIAQATSGGTEIDEDLAGWLVSPLEEMLPVFRSAGVFSAPPDDLPARGNARDRLLYLTGRRPD